MLRDAPARRPAFPYHEQAPNATARPSTLSGDGERETRLPIEREHGGLDIRHDRLHLDDEDGACRPVEGKDVDRPAFTGDAERHLDSNVPPETPQHRSHDFHERGVVVAVNLALELLNRTLDPKLRAS